MLTARTFENTCGIVFANAGGPVEEGYAGLSQVVMPFVGPVVRMGEPGEGMRVCEIDLGVLEEAEANYKVREDLAREDWHYPWK
jgi:predicted amidohydrolase